MANRKSTAAHKFPRDVLLFTFHPVFPSPRFFPFLQSAQWLVATFRSDGDGKQIPFRIQGHLHLGIVEFDASSGSAVAEEENGHRTLVCCSLSSCLVPGS
ncbi:hypothetical protein DAI22_09g125800 [Oryza sativa Japonica Group]|nr:hypothetical protein DAI22_09g125800 [Oryza sativa Japonica Group]